MAVILEDYGVVKVKNHLPNHYTFVSPLDGPRDIALADIATELNVYHNMMMFQGERYYAVSGVQKHMEMDDARWIATIESRRIDG